MSIAIKRKNGDLIWMDAVVSYSRQYSSSITKHPIESGSTITDNVSKENPKFSLTGVITNADFNTTRPFIYENDAAAYKLSDRRIYNSQPIPDGASPVIGKGASKLFKYLPQSVTQFTGVSPPSVNVPNSQRPDWVYTVEEILKTVERNHELVSILEFSHLGVIKKSHDDCYISNITFAETVDTGDSFDLNIDIEQVTFVSLRDEKLSDDVAQEISGKTSSKKSKGNISTPVGDTGTGGTADSPEDVLDAKDHETKLTDTSGLYELVSAGGLKLFDLVNKALGL